MAGNFEAVLLSHLMVDLLTGDGSCSEEEDIETYLERRVLLYLTFGTNNDQTSRLGRTYQIKCCLNWL